MIADVAMHEPGKEGDQRNYHAHILVTTRAVGPAGFGRKDPSWRTPQQVRDWRAGWAKIQNEHLQRTLGPDAPQVSHLSLAERGVDRAPTVHLGPSATALERKNIASETRRTEPRCGRAQHQGARDPARLSADGRPDRHRGADDLRAASKTGRRSREGSRSDGRRARRLGRRTRSHGCAEDPERHADRTRADGRCRARPRLGESSPRQN